MVNQVALHNHLLSFTVSVTQSDSRKPLKHFYNSCCLLWTIDCPMDLMQQG